MAEMRTFVFAVVFIIMFSALLTSIPAGLSGEGATPSELTPVDPALVGGFSSSEQWNTTEFAEYALYWIYGAYSLNSKEWFCYAYKTGGGDLLSIAIGSKALLGGVLWLGALDYVDFVYDSVNYGNTLSTSELATIASDAEDDTMTLSLQYEVNGNAAGSLVLYWNQTLYGTDAADAWDNNALYFVHGVGFEATASVNIALLLLQLLTLSIPGVPVLLGLLLASPMYAAIVYLFWYFIKETTPFL